MCDNCKTCQNLFSLNQTQRHQAKDNLNPCICQDSDYPFYWAVQLYQQLQK